MDIKRWATRYIPGDHTPAAAAMIEVIESPARFYREAADAGERVLVANDHA